MGRCLPISPIHVGILVFICSRAAEGVPQHFEAKPSVRKVSALFLEGNCCHNPTISTPHSEVVETHVAGDTHDNGEMDVEQRDEQVEEDADNESGNCEINQVRGCA